MMPITPWIREYKPSQLRYDLIAGLTLAAYLVPAGLADASLANLPPQAGLYACLCAGLVFWLFCSSRHTAITVTSGISLMVGSSLGELAGGDSLRFAALASGTALVVGVLSILAWLMRAGVIVNFISETVLVGFKTGIAFVLVSTQLPKLMGFSGTHGSFWERMSYTLQHIGSTNWYALAIGVSALILLVLGKIFLPHRPVALFVVILGIAASSFFELSDHGVRLLGTIPSGLPALQMPGLYWSDLNELLPLAMACFLLGSVETVAIGRMFALKHKYRFDPNREFLALASANIAAGFGQGYPVGGGMSQSLVNESARARSPLSGLVAALVTLLVAVFFSHLLAQLPQPVLAAIVLIAVAGLVHVHALRELWRFNREEFLVCMVAFVGVLGSGILRGVLIGVVLSLILLLRRASTPQTTELGRVPDTTFFANIFRHPENIREADIFVFRSEGALLYFNTEFVRDRFFELLENRGSGVRLAVFYLGMVPLLDLAGLALLKDIQASLKDRGIDFRIAEARGQIREILRRGEFEAVYGPVYANETVASVIEAWRRSTGRVV